MRIPKKFKFRRNPKEKKRKNFHTVYLSNQISIKGHKFCLYGSWILQDNKHQVFQKKNEFQHDKN